DQWHGKEEEEEQWKGTFEREDEIVEVIMGYCNYSDVMFVCEYLNVHNLCQLVYDSEYGDTWRYYHMDEWCYYLFYKPMIQYYEQASQRGKKEDDNDDDDNEDNGKDGNIVSKMQWKQWQWNIADVIHYYNNVKKNNCGFNGSQFIWEDMLYRYSIPLPLAHLGLLYHLCSHSQRQKDRSKKFIRNVMIDVQSFVFCILYLKGQTKGNNDNNHGNEHPLFVDECKANWGLYEQETMNECGIDLLCEPTFYNSDEYLYVMVDEFLLRYALVYGSQVRAHNLYEYLFQVQQYYNDFKMVHSMFGDETTRNFHCQYWGNKSFKCQTLVRYWVTLWMNQSQYSHAWYILVWDRKLAMAMTVVLILLLCVIEKIDIELLSDKELRNEKEVAETPKAVLQQICAEITEKLMKTLLPNQGQEKFDGLCFICIVDYIRVIEQVFQNEPVDSVSSDSDTDSPEISFVERVKSEV
ncbi:hypothetical protein RFI_28909, partial [Reticulomyxa filosa]